MSIHHDEPFDPAAPALLVTVGNTPRRHRALNRAAVLLGRAHGCDIGLSAPDVSSVHCLIYRGPGGLHIRDCQSRSGTHVNGLPIQEEVLRDGDAIQVGPFSFQAYIPPGSVEAPAQPAAPPAGRGDRLQHLEQARRRWARLALKLRRRLHEARATLAQQEEDARGLAERQAEVDRQAEFLRARAREYEQRARKLEDAERAVAADRAGPEPEVAEREQRVRQAEEELARRQATLEHDVESQWLAWQQHEEEIEGARRDLEVRETWVEKEWTALESRATQLERDLETNSGTLEELAPAGGEPVRMVEAVLEETRRLEIRARELDCYARHLWRLRRRLRRQLRQAAPPEPCPVA